MFEIDLTDIQEMQPAFDRLYQKRDEIKNSRPIPASAPGKTRHWNGPTTATALREIH